MLWDNISFVGRLRKPRGRSTKSLDYYFRRSSESRSDDARQYARNDRPTRGPRALRQMAMRGRGVRAN